MFEIRSAAELRAAPGGKLEGYAAVFDSPSRDLGGFIETVRPGAFTRTLRDAANVLALYDHDRRSVLGRVGAGTLRLAEDTRGLHFEVELPDTQIGRDLRILVDRKDVAGASFAFTVPKGGDTWDERGGKYHRELRDVNLHEITVTADPAYLDTTVARRHMPGRGFPRRSRLSRYLATC